MENWRIKLSQPSTKVEVEVEAELGNLTVNVSVISATIKKHTAQNILVL